MSGKKFIDSLEIISFKDYNKTDIPIQIPYLKK